MNLAYYNWINRQNDKKKIKMEKYKLDNPPKRIKA